MRTRVYVDGFNLYYGALKGTPFKWLDPAKLAALVLPRECAIDRLRYFTARVSGKLDPRAPARQQVYLRALATLPEVEVHYGRFLAKTAWRPLANLPVAGRRIETPEPVTLPRGNHRVLGERPRTLPVGSYPDRRRRGESARRAPGMAVSDTVIAEFHAMEEKGSDVNLAAHLLNDADRHLRQDRQRPRTLRRRPRRPWLHPARPAVVPPRVLRSGARARRQRPGGGRLPAQRPVRGAAQAYGRLGWVHRLDRYLRYAFHRSVPRESPPETPCRFDSVAAR